MGHSLDVKLGIESSPAMIRPEEKYSLFQLSYLKSIPLARYDFFFAMLKLCRFQNSIPLEHPSILFQ